MACAPMAALRCLEEDRICRNRACTRKFTGWLPALVPGPPPQQRLRTQRPCQIACAVASTIGWSIMTLLAHEAPVRPCYPTVANDNRTRPRRDKQAQNGTRCPQSRRLSASEGLGAWRRLAGLRVGRTLAERYTRDKPRMAEHLDVIKWTCKELWGEVFRKQARLTSTPATPQDAHRLLVLPVTSAQESFVHAYKRHRKQLGIAANGKKEGMNVGASIAVCEGASEAGAFSPTILMNVHGLCDLLLLLVQLNAAMKRLCSCDQRVRAPVEQVDSLRTNHRGTFVLKDNHFRWALMAPAHPPLSVYSELSYLVAKRSAGHGDCRQHHSAQLLLMLRSVLVRHCCCGFGPGIPSTGTCVPESPHGSTLDCTHEEPVGPVLRPAQRCTLLVETTEDASISSIADQLCAQPRTSR